MGFFSGTKQKVKQLEMLTPEQRGTLKKQLELSGMNMDDLFGQGSHVTESEAYQKGMGALDQTLGDFDPTRIQDSFQQGVANPARQNFQEQTIPGITERFAGTGGLRSGAYSGQMLKEGQNLESGLAGNLSNMLMQGEQQHNQMRSQGISQALQYGLAPEEEKKNLLAMMQGGMNTQAFQNQIIPGQASGFSSMIGPIAQAAGKAFAGPVGAAAGKFVAGGFGEK